MTRVFECIVASWQPHSSAERGMLKTLVLGCWVGQQWWRDECEWLGHGDFVVRVCECGQSWLKLSEWKDLFTGLLQHDITAKISHTRLCSVILWESCMEAHLCQKQINKHIKFVMIKGSQKCDLLSQVFPSDSKKNYFLFNKFLKHILWQQDSPFVLTLQHYRMISAFWNVSTAERLHWMETQNEHF